MAESLNRLGIPWDEGSFQEDPLSESASTVTVVYKGYHGMYFVGDEALSALSDFEEESRAMQRWSGEASQCLEQQAYIEVARTLLKQFSEGRFDLSWTVESVRTPRTKPSSQPGTVVVRFAQRIGGHVVRGGNDASVTLTFDTMKPVWIGYIDRYYPDSLEVKVTQEQAQAAATAYLASRGVQVTNVNSIETALELGGWSSEFKDATLARMASRTIVLAHRFRFATTAHGTQHVSVDASTGRVISLVDAGH